MNLEKLKQLALIDQMGAQPQVEQQKQDAQARMAMGLMQALMQQDAEAARLDDQATYKGGLLRQAQEGLDIRRDTLAQQKTMANTLAADKAAAAKLMAEDKKTAGELASSDKQLAVIMQLAAAGDPTAKRALLGMNPAMAKAALEMTNEATATRRSGVNARVKSLYAQNAKNPTQLSKALSGIYANPETIGVQGATVEDLNMVPYDEMNAGMNAATPDTQSDTRPFSQQLLPMLQPDSTAPAYQRYGENAARYLFNNIVRPVGNIPNVGVNMLSQLVAGRDVADYITDYPYIQPPQ
jgi:hypothetical protein